MTLADLQTALAAQRAKNGKVELLTAFAALGPRPAFADLLLSSLMATTDLIVDSASAPILDGDLQFSGTSDILNLTAVPVAVTITEEFDLQVRVTPVASASGGWTLASSFPLLTGYPVEAFALAGAVLAFTTKVKDSIKWTDPDGKSHDVEMAAGLTLIGSLSAGPFALVEGLLPGSGSLPLFSGRIVPPVAGAPGIPYPQLDLSGPIGTDPTPLPHFPLTSPKLRLRTPAVSPDPGVPFPAAEVSATLQKGSIDLDLSACIFKDSSRAVLRGAPPPGGTVTIEAIIDCLLLGSSFTADIPDLLTDAFGSVALQSFALALDAAGPAVESVSVELAAIPTPVALGPLNLDSLLLTYSVDAPGSGTAQSFATITAEFDFPDPPNLFTGKFQAEAYEDDNGIGISATYSQEVLLGDLLTAAGAPSVPGALAAMSFSDFGAAFSKDSAGWNWTLYGSAQILHEIVVAGITISAEVEAVITSTGGVKSYALKGGLIVGSEVFNLQVDLGAGSDNCLSATWQAGGEPLDFSEIAACFGWQAMPRPPSELDLGLVEASLTLQLEDSTSGDALAGDIVLCAKSAGGGAAVYLHAGAASGTSEPLNLFLLEVPLSIQLSKLPFVGDAIPAAEDFTVGSPMVAIASRPILEAEVGTLNQRLASSGLALAGPMQGEAGFMASLSRGSDPPIPVSIGFGGGTAPAPPPPAAADTATAATVPAPAPVPSSSSGATAWFPIQKTFGPVTLARIGIRYDSTSGLVFELDASMAFGPVTLTLIDLSLGSPLTSFDLKFGLHGLGIAYNSPPLTIAGTLVNMSPPGSSDLAFLGSVVAGTGEMTIDAVGYYGKVAGLTSLFVFAEVEEAFGGPPPFFITGVSGGAGYNSNVRIPAIADVATFPFLASLPDAVPPGSGGGGSDPTAALTTLMTAVPPWVTASSGDFWIAAGLTFTTYELVHSQAVVIVEGGHELTIALLGRGRARYPTGDGSPYAAMEVDLEARFAPAEGVFSIEAVLATGSFVLDPACALTGGLAFYLWFGSNANAGDFVFTLGGYHPAFDPPAWYPTVPRLGFNWPMDSSVTVSGQAYLALTPSAFMVGGELSVTYQDGNLNAWLDAHADVIVRWHPFWFDAQIGITVGASYRLDLLFTTVTVTVEMSCQLELWGPPTGGTISVDWYIISFTIPFGSDKTLPESTAWSNVEAILPGSGSGATRNIISLQPVDGLVTKQAPSSAAAAGDAGSLWVVRGGSFSFSSATPMPLTALTAWGQTVPTPGATLTNFRVHPLDWPDVTATHDVTVTHPVFGDVPTGFAAPRPIEASVPVSLWGGPGDQLAAAADQLLTGRITGVTLTALPPKPGASAGAIPLSTTLAYHELAIAGAALPIAAGQPTGDVPAASPDSIGTIIDAGKGIASKAAAANRAALVAALAGYAPATGKDLGGFAADLADSLTDPPMMVQ